jgi:hypothetical protein
LTIQFAPGLIRKTWRDRPQSDGYFKPSEQVFQIVVAHPYATTMAR